MSHTKLKKAFNKLQKKAGAILSEEENLSPLERDYIKQLTVQFYDALMTMDDPDDSEIDLKDLQNAIKNPTRKVETPVEHAEIIEKVLAARPQEPKLKSEANVAPKEDLHQEVQATAEADSRVEIDAPVDVEDTAYMALFESEQQGDLSDRLSQRPIDHISKAMGVNERIFMTNELFNGDPKAFTQHVEALNGVDNFVAAKRYMIENVIAQFEWDNESKAGQVKDFIKLVRRRHPEAV